MNERTWLADAKRWLWALHSERRPLFCSDTRPSLQIADLLLAKIEHKDSATLWSGVSHAFIDATGQRAACVAGQDRADCDGRLLVYMPDLEAFEELNDESPIVDKFDVPAWDMWAAIVMPQQAAFDGLAPDRALLAWVPHWYYAAAEEAIGCASAGALEWIDGDARVSRIREWAIARGLL